VGPVFLARLIGEPNSLGLWAVNSLGQLQLVALKGSQITVNGTEKIISEIDILSAVPGTPAQARSFNREQKLIYRLTFRGGDQKIVTELIP